MDKWFNMEDMSNPLVTFLLLTIQMEWTPLTNLFRQTAMSMGVIKEFLVLLPVRSIFTLLHLSYQPWMVCLLLLLLLNYLLLPLLPVDTADTERLILRPVIRLSFHTHHCLHQRLKSLQVLQLLLNRSLFFKRQLIQLRQLSHQLALKL